MIVGQFTLNLNSSMTMLVARIQKIRMAIMGDDQVTAAMAPQPTSRISSLMPKFCTMAWAAGPRSMLKSFE